MPPWDICMDAPPAARYPGDRRPVTPLRATGGKCKKAYPFGLQPDRWGAGRPPLGRQGAGRSPRDDRLPTPHIKPSPIHFGHSESFGATEIQKERVVRKSEAAKLCRIFHLQVMTFNLMYHFIGIFL